jgi:hypothetical protein
MAKWLRVQLSGGRLADGSRLFSTATARELTTIVTPIQTSEPQPELAPLKANFRGYALGFDIRDYRGRKLVTHTGGLPGYVSRVAMIPDANVGVAVLTNQEATQAFDAITFRILDHYLEAAPFDWIDGFEKIRDRMRAAESQRGNREASPAAGSSRPSLSLAKYAGTYRDAWYGDVSITESGGKLAMQFSRTPLLVGDLLHWQHDTFVVRWRDRELRADAYVTFALNPDGSIDQVKMKAVSPDTDFSYDFHDLLLKPVPR